MKLNETTLSFLQEDCIMEFGKENGSDLYLNTEKTYQELLANADDKGNPVIHEHLAKKLFPPMAYYKALLAASLCGGSISGNNLTIRAWGQKPTINIPITITVREG